MKLNRKTFSTDDYREEIVIEIHGLFKKTERQVRHKERLYPDYKSLVVAVKEFGNEIGAENIINIQERTYTATDGDGEWWVTALVVWYKED